MITSPSNLIEGVILILKANAEDINAIAKQYRKTDTLHLFKGMRKTLPQSAFPSLELEATSGAMSWLTTSAQAGEYTIDCTLTVNAGTSVEAGLEYICDLTRKIVQVLNAPVNMTWPIPNEFWDTEGKVPQLCQYSAVSSVEYTATRDFAIRVARWQISCRVIEPFPMPGELLGPSRQNWHPVPLRPK